MSIKANSYQFPTTGEKAGYNPEEEFKTRTLAALAGDNRLRRVDMFDFDDDEDQVVFMRDQVGLCGNPDILEVGCGFGRWSRALSGLYGSYIGVDPDRDRIKWASANNVNPSATFLHVANSGWELNRKFDVIFTSFVLQHLPLEDTKALLRTMRLHLKDGGAMYLYEGRLLDATSDEARQMYLDPSCPRHMVYKSIRDLKSAIPDLQWKLVHSGWPPEVKKTEAELHCGYVLTLKDVP